MNAAYKQILKATTLFGSVQGFNIVINLVRTKLVAVLLGPTGVGLNSIYNETRELLHCSTNFGLDVSGVRGISAAYEKSVAAKTEEEILLTQKEIKKQVELLRSWVLLLALLGTMVCAIFATPLSLFTFDDYDHVWEYVILSPAVGFSTVTCGEMAVLKGLRQIKSLAQVSILNVLAALCFTIPIYYIWGMQGIIPAILSFTFASMVITLLYGFRAHGLSFTFRPDRLKAGNLMLGIGFVVVISESMGHVVKLIIQSYLNTGVSTEMVGLYNSAYTLTMVYAGMVFAAMETDYFPRISGVANDLKARSETVVKQIEVTLMLVIPMLILFIVLMPYLVPLLLDRKFESIIPMAQVTAIGLLFRAVVLPNSYLALAKGDSRIFFIINMVGALDMLIVIPGYIYGGLFGMGVALTVQNFIDMMLCLAISRFYYKVEFSRLSVIGTLIGTMLLVATYFIVC